VPARTPPVEPKQQRAIETRRRLLDAAVDELTTSGYVRLTTSAVAHRAGVSRGAQQHYFPHKEVLLGEAVRHLAERQIEELRAHIAAAPVGRARAEVALDTIFKQYGGSLFAAMVELALAARTDEGLAPIVAEQERLLSQAVHEIATDAFGAEHAATAVSAARGLAMLRLFGYPDDAVARQWRRTRADVLRLLS
jgi:AcrR family transcriptional regulator